MLSTEIKIKHPESPYDNVCNLLSVRPKTFNDGFGNSFRRPRKLFPEPPEEFSEAPGIVLFE